MEPVLVIGGSGFIGRHLVRRLASEGIPIWASHSPRRALAPQAGVTWVECNLADNLARASWPSRCQAVFFLAQSPYWKLFPEAAEDVFAVNVAAVFQAALLARSLGARRFIYASTGSVYPSTGPAQEAELPDPAARRSFYAATKLASETLLGGFQDFFHVINLRLFVPYGPEQSAQMLMPSLVERVRRGEPVLLHDGDGLQANPTAVADVVEVMWRCLTHSSSAVWNVAGPQVLTLRTIAETIGNIIGRRPSFQSQPGTPPLLIGGTTRLQHQLGWVPGTPLDQGLRDWLQPEALRKSA